MKVFRICLAIFLAAFGIGILAYNHFVLQDLDRTDVIKAVIILIGAVYALVGKKRTY